MATSETFKSNFLEGTKLFVKDQTVSKATKVNQSRNSKFRSQSLVQAYSRGRNPDFRTQAYNQNQEHGFLIIEPGQGLFKAENSNFRSKNMIKNAFSLGSEPDFWFTSLAKSKNMNNLSETLSRH